MANVQGHMMLRHAMRDHNELNMIIGPAFNDSNVHRISSALRSAYRNKLPYGESHTTDPGHAMNNMSGTASIISRPDFYLSKQPEQRRGPDNGRTLKNSRSVNNSSSNIGNDNRHRHQERPRNSSHPSFFQSEQPESALHLEHLPSYPSHAIVDSGACASLIGEDTL